MQSTNFEALIEKIIAHDPRYHRESYLFVREALDYTQRKICESKSEDLRHITGQELIKGIRDFALAQYGPMALLLLHEWGIHRCEDFGEIVFNMVDFGLLNKTESDSRDDFKNGYDLHDAFVKPFLPSSQSKPPLLESQADLTLDNPEQN